MACLFALGVAFFPNSGGNWERIVNFSSAAGLFLTLSFFSLFLFTKTEESPKGLRGTLSNFRFGVIKSSDPRKSQKKIRNRVYIDCGLVMLACMVLTGMYYWLFKNTTIFTIKPVFWLESFMIWAFGISWFIKGETLWQDKKIYSERDRLVYSQIVGNNHSFRII
jgi:hypothetical protein